MAATRRPNPEAFRQNAGIALYILLVITGLLLFLLVFILPALAGGSLGAMFAAFFCAVPPLLVYLWLPWVIDRYDPEPWWCLAMALVWGAIAAVGFAGLINTVFEGVAAQMCGDQCGEILGTCVSAPLVEEFWKGLGVFGFFFFLRREFDGVVDGIIYATFIALGFAATENIIYYSNAILDPHQSLGGTFFIRGVLGPWGHPLYTSMTGIGFGIARETTKKWVKVIAPLGGYCAAVFLHFVWNFTGSFSGELMLLMLPLWGILVLGFLAIVIYLVRRKGKIIRKFLADEVMMGNLTRWELELVCSAFGRMKATWSYGGATGRRFIRTAARLGLSKWHTARAHKGRAKTVSIDFIVPLRQELFALREQIGVLRGGRIERPEPWSPPQNAPHAPGVGGYYAPQQGGYPPQGGAGGGGWPPR